jgi:hypothetical protein
MRERQEAIAETTKMLASAFSVWAGVRPRSRTTYGQDGAIQPMVPHSRTCPNSRSRPARLWKAMELVTDRVGT